MMTENQWTNAGQSFPQDTVGGSQSKKDAVKDEASSVAGDAVAAVQGVAETAKEEAVNVASEVKSSAQDLLSQAKTGLTDQAGTQQQKAVEGIRTISSQLQSMADAPDQQGIASDLIRQAAQRSESVASWLENKQPADLLGEIQRFARNKPGTFLLLAAGAGVLAGRLTNGLTAGTPAQQTAIPPLPAQAPATEAIVTSGIGEPFYDAPTATPAAYGDTIYGEPARPADSGTETGGYPLKSAGDPFSDVEKEGRHL